MQYKKQEQWGVILGIIVNTIMGIAGVVIYRITKRWCALRLAKKDMPTETSCYRVPYNVAEEREERE